MHFTKTLAIHGNSKESQEREDDNAYVVKNRLLTKDSARYGLRM